jgi:hypothetical protein
MIASLLKNNAQSVASGPIVKTLFNSTLIDNTGRMADLANSQIVCVRPARYDITGGVRYSNLSASGSMETQLYVSSASIGVQTSFGIPSGVFPAVLCQSLASLAVGATVDVRSYQSTAVAQNLYVAEQHNYLVVKEICEW